MDSKYLSDDDLSDFLEDFRALATNTKSRFWMDLFCLIETETLARHRYTPVDDLTNQELNDAALTLKAMVDDLRSQGAPDEYPALRFLLLAMQMVVEEGERREKGMAIN